jgi:hypothetical protein
MLSIVYLDSLSNPLLVVVLCCKDNNILDITTKNIRFGDLDKINHAIISVILLLQTMWFITRNSHV